MEVLVKQNKKDEAQQLVADVLKEDPKDSEAIAIRASLSLLTGTREQLQSAINDLQTVVSRMPENPVLRYNLGKALLAKGNAQAARVQFDEAIKLSSGLSASPHHTGADVSPEPGIRQSSANVAGSSDSMTQTTCLPGC